MHEDADFEGREQEEMTRRLAEMKRNLRGMEQGLKQTSRMIERLTKKGVAVPAEYQSLITELTAALSVIKNAEEWTQEVEAAMGVIEEKGDDLRDIGPRLGMLEQWPRMEKQAVSQIARLLKALARAKKAKGNAQYTALVVKIEGEVGAIKERFAETKELAAGGDMEAAMETFHDFFDDINEIHQSIGFLDQLRNMTKMLRDTEREVARFEKSASQLEKQGKNVGTLRGIISEGKEKLAELKALAGKSEADPEELFADLDELRQVRRRAVQEFDRLNGSAERKALQGAVIQAIELRRVGMWQ